MGALAMKARGGAMKAAMKPAMKAAAMKKTGMKAAMKVGMKVMKAMKAMKAMKIKRTSTIARGRMAKARVFAGKKAKTVGGLTKETLTKSKTGKIVSKAASARAKKNFATSAL